MWGGPERASCDRTRPREHLTQTDHAADAVRPYACYGYGHRGDVCVPDFVFLCRGLESFLLFLFLYQCHLYFSGVI